MFLKYYILDEKTNFRDMLRKNEVPCNYCVDTSTGVLRMPQQAV
jgi:hypothetical protein